MAVRKFFFACASDAREQQITSYRSSALPRSIQYYAGLHLPLILPLQERAAGLLMSDRPDNRAPGPGHCRSLNLQQGQRAQEPPRVRQGLHQI